MMPTSMKILQAQHSHMLQDNIQVQIHMSYWWHTDNMSLTDACYNSG